MAAVAVSQLHVSAVGDRKQARAKLTHSGNYATDGTAVSAASLGLNYIERLVPSPADIAGIYFAWDLTPGTSVNLVAYDEDNTSGIAAEYTNAAAITSVVDVLAIGY
jgi:hypothetical protein